MIHVEATIKYKGYNPDTLTSGSNKRICVICDHCGRVRYVRKRDYRDLCFNCSMIKQKNNPIWQKNQAEGSRRIVSDPEWIRKQRAGMDKIMMNPDWQIHLKEGAKKRVLDPVWIKNHKDGVVKNAKNSEWLKKITENNRNRVKDPDWSKRLSAGQQGISFEEWDGFVISVSARMYNSSEYKEWRKSVFKRDNYTCQMCDKRGGKLNSHHIYKFSNNPEFVFDINNGITLCYDCHVSRVNQHEEEYEIEFLSRIFDNKGIEIFGGK